MVLMLCQNAFFGVIHMQILSTYIKIRVANNVLHLLLGWKCHLQSPRHIASHSCKSITFALGQCYIPKCMHYIWVEGQCQKWSLAAVTAAPKQMILDATKKSIVVTIIIRLSTIINVSDHDRRCSGSDQGRRTTRPCLPARLTTRLSRWTTNMLTPSLINQPTDTNPQINQYSPKW